MIRRPPRSTLLSLHDALPISFTDDSNLNQIGVFSERIDAARCRLDRKSTRLNSSHDQISYAVFCLKKKNQPDAFGSQSDMQIIQEPVMLIYHAFTISFRDSRP